MTVLGELYAKGVKEKEAVERGYKYGCEETTRKFKRMIEKRMKLMEKPTKKGMISELNSIRFGELRHIQKRLK